MKSTHRKEAPKRHCMIVHAHYPIGEVRVEREALALIDRGYEVDVICLQNAGEPAIDVADGVNIYRLPVSRNKERGRLFQFLEYMTFLILAFGKVLSLHLRRRYGVVQAHNLPDFLVFAALGPKLMGARVILDIHDLMSDFYAAQITNKVGKRLLPLVILQERLSCSFADHVITVTEVWRQTLISRGIPPEKISVVMNVADPRIFHRNGNGKSPDKANGRFEIIYHGTMTHRYGIDLIIRAVHKVRSTLSEVHLSLIGRGEARNDLEMLTKELGLEDCVEFSQQVVHVSKLPHLIEQAHVGVVPNRNDLFTGELLPTKLMEYVALGTPVIAARTRTISTYFDDSMVMFFRPDDADDLANCILTLHQHREKLESLAHNADKFNQKYNWAKVSAEYVALVDRLNQNRPNQQSSIAQ